jgi:hypothetical protein
VRGKHILRGGYGLYFGQLFGNINRFMIQQANPDLFATVFSFTITGPGDPSCTSATPACFVPGTNIHVDAAVFAHRLNLKSRNKWQYKEHRRQAEATCARPD